MPLPMNIDSHTRIIPVALTGPTGEKPQCIGALCETPPAAGAAPKPKANEESGAVWGTERRRRRRMPTSFDSYRLPPNSFRRRWIRRPLPRPWQRRIRPTPTRAIPQQQDVLGSFRSFLRSYWATHMQHALRASLWERRFEPFS